MLDAFKTLTNGILEKAKTFKGDWNENDSSSPNYIKNRPFYSEDGFETLFKQTVFFQTYQYEDNAFASDLPGTLDTIPLEEGKEYIVVWNDVEYICKAIPCFGTEFYLGNGAIPFDHHEDTGEPFAIFVSPYSVYMEVNPIIESAEVKIKRAAETIHRIDKKYLPDDIQKINEDEVNNMIMNTYGYSNMNTYEIVIEHNHANTIYMTNHDTVVYANSSYTNTFTIRDGEISYVHVEMNGETLDDVTEFINYKEYRVNIPNVIGNIEIYIYTLS